MLWHNLHDLGIPAAQFAVFINRLEWADTLMSTEECSYEDLRAFLDTLTPIDDFIPITDDSYLTN